jgi:hypothetical protein
MKCGYPNDTKMSQMEYMLKKKMYLPKHIKGKDCHMQIHQQEKMSWWGRETSILLKHMTIKDEKLEYKRRVQVTQMS